MLAATKTDRKPIIDPRGDRVLRNVRAFLSEAVRCTWRRSASCDVAGKS
jgi:hypothetical protein